MLKKRLIAVILSVVMSAAVFTGCASKDDSSKSDSGSTKKHGEDMIKAN